MCQFSRYAVRALKASDLELLQVTVDLCLPLSLNTQDSPLLSSQNESTTSIETVEIKSDNQGRRVLAIIFLSHNLLKT